MNISSKASFNLYLTKQILNSSASDAKICGQDAYENCTWDYNIMLKTLFRDSQ